MSRMDILLLTETEDGMPLVNTYAGAMMLMLLPNQSGMNVGATRKGFLEEVLASVVGT